RAAGNAVARQAGGITMKPIAALAAWLVVAAAPPIRGAPGRDGEVKAVSVLPAPGRVEVVIDLRGAVEVQDFTLASPARLVLDLQGARLVAPAALPSRGGQAARVAPPSASENPVSIDAYLAAHASEAAQSQAPRITVTWDRADIQEVVAGFAAFSGRTIVVNKGIAGQLSAEI